MEVVESILKMIESIAGSSGVDLWLKAILSLIVGIVGIYYAFNKRKIRRDTANSEQNRDRTQDVEDNRRTETQNARDGQSVRDQMRGGGNG